MTRAAAPERTMPAAAVGAGLLTGLNVLLRAIAMASLVFAGPFDAFLPTGIALAVASAAVVSAIVALASSYGGSIATISESNGILALVAVSILAGTSAAVEPSRALPTVLAAIALSTLAIGAALLALGMLRLGRLVRYIPYPVIAGFQAGIGWLLVQGAFNVSLDRKLSTLDLQAFIGGDLLLRWGPALALGALLVAGRRRVSPAIAIPAVLLACVAVFWIAALGYGESAATLTDGGWLLGPYPPDGLWHHLAPLPLLDGVDWSLVPDELPKLGVMVLIALVGVLLTGTSLELLSRRDIDLDRELRAAGIANLVAGAAGGMHGYQSLSVSTLGARMRAPFRATGLVCAAFCAAAFFAGSAFLDFLPKLVPAVLLFYLGLDMLDAWLLRARRRLGGADYAVVVTVFSTVVLVGFVEGVVVGMLAAVVLFAVSSSRINVVKQAFTGAQLHSTALRSEYPRAMLQDVGRAIFVLRLNGYVFFGTAYRMVHELRARLDDPQATPLRFLLLDLRLVTGIDASAVISVRKLAQYAQDHGFEVALADAPESVARLLDRAGIAPERRERHDALREAPERRAPTQPVLDGSLDAGSLHLRMFPDLDHGLEWCETTLLNERDKGGTRRMSSLRHGLARTLGDPARVDRFLAAATLESYLPGERLLRQGSRSTHMLLIRTGTAIVRMRAPGGRKVRLRRLGPGAVVGEVAFYIGGTRTASVIAEEPTTAYRITREAMKALQALEPELCLRFHILMARTLSERVHDTDATLAALSD